jgi:3-oxoacyl-[acyl-carrier protein] reductase
MDLHLSGKTALVSASTGGIGLAIATQLLEEGASVVINGRDAASVTKVVETLNGRLGGHRALPLAADFGMPGSEKIAAATYPQIDILVNNLGTYTLSDFFSTSDDDWRRLFEVNVWSGVRLARTYMKGMLERGGGRVIFISSELALTPMTSLAHYSASKATQLSISRSLAELTRGTAVTVNCVLPGATGTESLKSFIQSVYPSLSYDEAERKFMAENKPSSLISRLAKPAEVANVVAFLASDQAAIINGASVRAEGGVIPTIL